MYQWKEHCDKDNDGESYRYECVWSEEKIDSHKFAHTNVNNTNPDNEWPFTSQTLEAAIVSVG